MLRRLATGDEWWRPLPPGVSADVLRVLAARGVRAFGDGFVALLLPIYLVERGFSALAVGTIVTGTLVGTIWQVQDNIAVDFGLRGARINGQTTGEIRAGVTFAFGVTKGPDLLSRLFAPALRKIQ